MAIRADIEAWEEYQSAKAKAESEENEDDKAVPNAKKAIWEWHQIQLHSREHPVSIVDIQNTHASDVAFFNFQIRLNTYLKQLLHRYNDLAQSSSVLSSNVIDLQDNDMVRIFYNIYDADLIIYIYR